jgi:hypothetical protein
LWAVKKDNCFDVGNLVVEKVELEEMGELNVGDLSEEG